jgi:hypothetical protein
MPLGLFHEEARHHIGVVRYAITWTRGSDLGYAGSLLSALVNHWTERADMLLTRTISYVAATLNLSEYHVVSTKEAKLGLMQRVETDASHAGHADMRGQQCISIEIRAAAEQSITRIHPVFESRKSKLAGTSSSIEELRGAARGTTVGKLTADVAESLMVSVAEQKKGHTRAKNVQGQLVREELIMDAQAAISQILNGHSSTTSQTRHSKIQTQFLHEYWRTERRTVKHQRGTQFLPDIGTKALGVQRFRLARSLAPVEEVKAKGDKEEKK